jgi:hypothetical protein
MKRSWLLTVIIVPSAPGVQAQVTQQWAAYDPTFVDRAMVLLAPGPSPLMAQAWCT